MNFLNLPRAAYLWRGFLLVALLSVGASLTASAASTTAVLDAGGRRTSSASYTMDGSLGSVSGLGTIVTPSVIARAGYVGQLYEVQSFVLSASPTQVNETATSQLAVKALLNDASVLVPSATEVAWSVLTGPVIALSAAGLATTTNVYQNTSATVRADYQARSGTLDLLVLNVGNDDFGLYAHDGLDDAWQIRYFGLNNPKGTPTSDPDGDGVSNALEYLADTNPTNALSYFHVQSISNATRFTVFYPSSSNRQYTLYYRTNLTSGAWTNLATQTAIPGSGRVDALSDPAPTGKQRFYRVGVRLP